MALSLLSCLPAGAERAAHAGAHLAAQGSEIGFLESLDRDSLPSLIRSITERPGQAHLRVTRIVGDAPPSISSAYLQRAYADLRSDGLRCKFLEGIGRARDPQTLGWLSGRLSEPSLAVRCFALWAIGELSDPRAMAILEKRLSDPEPYLRWVALDAMGKIPGPRSIEPLVRAYDTGDTQTRFIAARSLGAQPRRDWAGKLFERLWREPSIDVQEALAASLGRSADSITVDKLLALLHEDAFPARQHLAALALGRCDPRLIENAPAVLTDLRRGGAARQMAVLAILPRGTKGAAAEEVLRLLQSGSASVRAAAASAIERMAPSVIEEETLELRP